MKLTTALLASGLAGLWALGCVPTNRDEQPPLGGIERATGGTTGTGGRSGGGGSSPGAGGTQSTGSGGGSGGNVVGTGGGTGSGGMPGTGGGASEGTGGGASTEIPDASGNGNLDAAENDAPPVVMIEPPEYPPIAACDGSVDHLRVFTAWNGTTSPAAGSSILTKADGKSVAKVSYIKCTPPIWCEMVVPVTNSLASQVDLSASKGFSMTYSATAELWVQVRPASRYHGGDKWVIRIPPTGGKVETHFFPFVAQAWFFLNRLGKPNYPFETALKDLRSFDFVGNVPNELVIQGLRIDGHVPSCK